MVSLPRSTFVRYGCCFFSRAFGFAPWSSSAAISSMPVIWFSTTLGAGRFDAGTVFMSTAA